MTMCSRLYVGHCGLCHRALHPRVVQAIKDQAERLLHMSGTDFYYEPQMFLQEAGVPCARGRGEENLLRELRRRSGLRRLSSLPRYHTRRELNIAFFGAFHGRTMGASP